MRSGAEQRDDRIRSSRSINGSISRHIRHDVIAKHRKGKRIRGGITHLVLRGFLALVYTTLILRIPGFEPALGFASEIAHLAPHPPLIERYLEVPGKICRSIMKMAVNLFSARVYGQNFSLALSVSMS
ncbi:hypothetical protein RRF57_010867 [Xylaria bambusicola]|uniref:Uncharacterized protein n=1 Tax=Xylaria bambusicola TaxID=326684 RepID=A0AAN7ULV7_9PEZI